MWMYLHVSIYFIKKAIKSLIVQAAEVQETLYDIYIFLNIFLFFL